MKIVFMGTPDFSVPVLRRLAEEGHEVGYVVTQPDRARSRNRVTFSPVKEAAMEMGIEVLQPERLKDDTEVKQKLFDYSPDLIIVVAYGQILKKDILELPKYGCFNVHGSLLPKLRGAAPMQSAILQGDEVTGVTIMKMGEGLDDGDMAAWEETSIDHKNFEQIHDELSVMGADLMCRVIPDIVSGKAVYLPQKDEEATYARRLVKQDGKIDFSRSPEAIERQIRAFDPWPGAFCTNEQDGRMWKIWKAECPDTDCSEAPGTVVASSPKGIDISCGGQILRVTELQIQGKKRMAADAFLRGRTIEKGTKFI